MPSDAYNAMVALLGQPQPIETPVEQYRTSYDFMGSMLPMADGVAASDGVLGGSPVRTFAVEGTEPSRTILYFHGGGYVIGSPESHQALTSHLAAAANATVHSVAYRLAPEHPYPAALDDAVAVYEALIDAGTDPVSIILAGDSAGGGLALAALLTARERQLPYPAGAVLLSPWLDLTQSGLSVIECPFDVLLSAEQLDVWSRLYAGAETDRHQPSLSPLFADLTGLPPILVHVGTEERLLDDSRRLAERAAACTPPLDLTLHVGDGMMHVWHYFAGSTPEADEGVAALAEWIVLRTP